MASLLYKAITKDKWDCWYQDNSHTGYQKLSLYLLVEYDFKELVLESGFTACSGEGHNCKVFSLIKATLKLIKTKILPLD